MVSKKKKKSSEVSKTQKKTLKTLAYTIIPNTSKKYSLVKLTVSIPVKPNDTLPTVDYTDVFEPASLIHTFNEFKIHTTQFLKALWNGKLNL